MREAINFDVQMCTQMWSQPNSPSVHGKGVCVYPDSHPETPLNYRTMHKSGAVGECAVHVLVLFYRRIMF